MESLWSLVERRLKLVEYTKNPEMRCQPGQASEVSTGALWLPRLAQLVQTEQNSSQPCRS